jgi:hypothetical protein
MVGVPAEVRGAWHRRLPPAERQMDHERVAVQADTCAWCAWRAGAPVVQPCTRAHADMRQRRRTRLLIMLHCCPHPKSPSPHAVSLPFIVWSAAACAMRCAPGAHKRGCRPVQKGKARRCHRRHRGFFLLPFPSAICFAVSTGVHRTVRRSRVRCAAAHRRFATLVHQAQPLPDGMHRRGFLLTHVRAYCPFPPLPQTVQAVYC